MVNETDITFETVKMRLDEIVDAVNADGISLDDALDLYEEAVKLGMKASTMLEEGISEQDVDATNETDEAGEIGTEQAESTDVGQEAASAAYEGEDGISLQQ